uniref:Reticulon-like protein n=1 Tax=Calcidiscus leptoporus TaxID=127549 RepID=A0A7S0NQE6_9EUKA
MDLLMWRNPLSSALVFAICLFGFFLNGILGYSSITIFAYIALAHIVSRIVYTNARTVLAEMNVLEQRQLVRAPDYFVSEDELTQLVPAAAAAINNALHTVFGLLVGECNLFTGHVNVALLKLAAALYVLSFLGKALGTTGVFFVLFVAAFTGPKLFEKKRREIEHATAVLKEKAEAVARAATLQLSGFLSKVKKS